MNQLLLDETIKAVAEVWPEVRSQGIHECTHVMRIPWNDLKRPFAVVAIEELEKDEDLSGVLDVYRVPVQVYYVLDVLGPSSPVGDKLHALRRALNTWPQEKIQLSTRGTYEMSWSADLLPNQILLESKNTSAIAGRLVFEALVGEGTDP